MLLALLCAPRCTTQLPNEAYRYNESLRVTLCPPWQGLQAIETWYTMS